MSGDDRVDEVIAGHMPTPEQMAATKLREDARIESPGGYTPPRSVNVFELEDRIARLEAHLFDPCDTEENGDKPEPLELVGGSIQAPGFIAGDRADQARALLDAVNTIKATGGAVEIAGVRIEACDEYGRTATTKRADAYADRADFFREACDNAGRGLADADARIEQLTRDRDQARDTADRLREQLEKARAERNLALKGAESAERDAGPLETPTPADPADYGTDNDARHHQERADRLERDRDKWRRVANDRRLDLKQLRRDKGELKRDLAAALTRLDATRAERDAARTELRLAFAGAESAEKDAWPARCAETVPDPNGANEPWIRCALNIDHTEPHRAEVSWR